MSPLALGDRITCLPIVHGSGHCALIVRKWLLENEYDCVAVCLPDSFRSQVLEGITALPTPSIVLQRCMPDFGGTWQAPGSELSLIHI